MKTNPLDFEISFYEGVIRRSPNYIEALVPLAEAYTRKGLYEKGLAIDERLSKLCKDNPVICYNLACSYALVGRRKEALAALRKAIRLGYRDFSHMRQDHDLKFLQGDPEFEKILKGR